MATGGGVCTGPRTMVPKVGLLLKAFVAFEVDPEEVECAGALVSGSCCGVCWRWCC